MAADERGKCNSTVVATNIYARCTPVIAPAVSTHERTRSGHLAIGVFLTVAALAAAAPIGAQAADALDMLAPPTTVMMCRSHPPAPEDSAAVVLEFVDGAEQPHGRKSLVAYDSLGGPLHATIIASHPSTNGGFTITGIGVRFAGDVRGGWRMAAILTPGAGSPTREKSVSLTDAEVARARELAVWFWDHRCGRRVSSR